MKAINVVVLRWTVRGGPAKGGGRVGVIQCVSVIKHLGVRLEDSIVDVIKEFELVPENLGPPAPARTRTTWYPSVSP